MGVCGAGSAVPPRSPRPAAADSPQHSQRPAAAIPGDPARAAASLPHAGAHRAISSRIWSTARRSSASAGPVSSPRAGWAFLSCPRITPISPTMPRPTARAGCARWCRRYLGRFHARSRRVYTPSSQSRKALLSLGLSKVDVEVWGRGVDTELFHPGRRSQELRAAFGMGSRFTFLYVGRLAPEKRVDQVVDAFRLASEMLPKGVIHLVLAGTGPREAELRAAAPPGVTFLGFLDRQSAGCPISTPTATPSSSPQSPRRSDSSCSRPWRAGCR